MRATKTIAGKRVKVKRPSKAKRRATRLPDLSSFRASIKISGQPLSREIIEHRRSSRF